MLTRDAHQRLADELERLRTEGRRRMADRLETAPPQSARSERTGSVPAARLPGR